MHDHLGQLSHTVPGPPLDTRAVKHIPETRSEKLGRLFAEVGKTALTATICRTTLSSVGASRPSRNAESTQLSQLLLVSALRVEGRSGDGLSRVTT
jgi:hypothetical protein